MSQDEPGRQLDLFKKQNKQMLKTEIICVDNFSYQKEQPGMTITESGSQQTWHTTFFSGSGMSTSSPKMYILLQWDDTYMPECLEPSAIKTKQGDGVGGNYSRGGCFLVKVMKEASPV